MVFTWPFDERHKTNQSENSDAESGSEGEENAKSTISVEFVAPEPNSGFECYKEIDQNVFCPDLVPRVKVDSKILEKYPELNGVFLRRVIEKVKQEDPNVQDTDVLKGLLDSFEGVPYDYLLQTYQDVATKTKTEVNLENRTLQEDVEVASSKFCRICLCYCAIHNLSAEPKQNIQSQGPGSSGSSSKKAQKKKSNLKYVSVVMKNTHVPCTHTGICDRTCGCKQNLRYCEKRCLCLQDCPNRYPGKVFFKSNYFAYLPGCD